MPPGEGGGRAVNDRSARVVRPAARRLAGEDTAGCGGREAARSVVDGSGGWPPSFRPFRGGQDLGCADRFPPAGRGLDYICTS